MKDASHVEGEMWSGEVTPDGYIVDGSGRWTDAQGIVQFLEGKGILTFKQSHAQSRFSSGGSGEGAVRIVIRIIQNQSQNQDRI